MLLLNLDNNQIQTITPEIYQLSNLEYLSLGGNQIKIIPPEIRQLNNLRRLFLYNNQIKIIPPEIGYLGVVTNKRPVTACILHPVRVEF